MTNYELEERLAALTKSVEELKEKNAGEKQDDSEEVDYVWCEYCGGNCRY